MWKVVAPCSCLDFFSTCSIWYRWQFSIYCCTRGTHIPNDLRLDSLIVSFLVSDVKAAAVSMIAFWKADDATFLAFPYKLPVTSVTETAWRAVSAPHLSYPSLSDTDLIMIGSVCDLQTNLVDDGRFHRIIGAGPKRRCRANEHLMWYHEEIELHGISFSCQLLLEYKR